MVVIIILFGPGMIGGRGAHPSRYYLCEALQSIPRRLLYLHCNKLFPLTSEKRKICHHTGIHLYYLHPPLCKQRKWLCNGYRVRPATTPRQYFTPGPSNRLSISRLETYPTKDQRDITLTFCRKWQGVSCPYKRIDCR